MTSHLLAVTQNNVPHSSKSWKLVTASWKLNEYCECVWHVLYSRSGRSIALDRGPINSWLNGPQSVPPHRHSWGPILFGIICPSFAPNLRFSWRRWGAAFISCHHLTIFVFLLDVLGCKYESGAEEEQTSEFLRLICSVFVYSCHELSI